MRHGKVFELTLASIGAAFIFWYFIFVIQPFNFWYEMSLVTGILFIFSLWLGKRSVFGRFRMRHIWIGIGSAVLLYGIFWLGNILSRSLLPFQPDQIAAIYSNRAKAPLWLISMLLVFPIAAGEEIYWRGLVQNTLTLKWGKRTALLVASAAYASVHIVTLNFMLVMAALVAGFFWGWIYYREESVFPGLISHIVWDLLIFVFFPI